MHLCSSHVPSPVHILFGRWHSTENWNMVMASSHNSIHRWCAVHSNKSMINSYSNLLWSPSVIVRVTGSIHHLGNWKYFRASTVEVVEDLKEQVGHLNAVVHEVSWPGCRNRVFGLTFSLPDCRLFFLISNLISSPLPIVVARYFFTLLVPSLNFLLLPLPSGAFRSRLPYVLLPSYSLYMLPTCSS